MGLDYVIRLLAQCHVVLVLMTRLAGAQERPIIETDKGTVQGVTVFADGKKVDAFYGIPFAKPPLGDLRFKPPAQLDSWEGVLDASRLPNSCMQGFDRTFGNFTGSNMWNPNTPVSEDCLYLNVWVPRTNPPYKDKSVIVWVYGGGFYSGSSTLDIYDARYLAAENDVVVVSMQYRVGALGFLTLNTPEAPGNAGLWDQRMALEWVNRNIHKFSGNTRDVTLMGESAGACSVGLFLICDLCRGYFHKAILQSGSPAADWTALPKEEMWRRSESLASHYNCNKPGDPDYVIRCLRQVNATEFPIREPYMTHGIMQFAFVPVIDGIFIRQDPQEMLRLGRFKKVPLLLGSVENESTFFIIYINSEIFRLDTDSPLTAQDYRNLMTQQAFKFYPYYPHKLNDFGIEAVMFHYRNWINPDDGIENRKSFDRAVSDNYFVCSVNRLARAYAREGAPVYYYWFNQRWSANPWPEWMGTLHADEIWFTFGHPLNRTHSFTEAERELSKKIMKYFTNFAKTGDPNKAPGEVSSMEWPLFQENEQLYLNLSTDSLVNGPIWGAGPRAQDCAFWDMYMPKLVAETSDISEAEREWKAEFHTWKTRYIVDWKTQFDHFLHNYQRRMGTCGDRP
ncbi:acetylcholinesterase-like isoform X1 [Aplysia californica]|uniref:Acetylcholinesterase n=1 Tax=Aplysia californica TaxID=6500 RepID=R4VD32_APLCA|nr:acetylcholinesterase-like precursor [Aplysia californica]XP_012936378.1 acetylcholinesterase-like isoform X1 [Aplysia californica]XP_012936379.1 acetylcholinesterase-like isoform X1 [Aplysia californica]XP_012936381.1 acetylcholinesterase-like isoform X1 [Aplysia californica]AGM37743.1 acetylcholinesterase [Aplysia californica]